MVTGSTIIPDSLRLTRSTSSACRSMGKFLWMTPMPPCCAMAMARRLSVTVSIAAEQSGMRKVYAARELRRGVGLGGQHLGARGHEQHVVEGQPFLQVVRYHL